MLRVVGRRRSGRGRFDLFRRRAAQHAGAFVVQLYARRPVAHRLGGRKARDQDLPDRQYDPLRRGFARDAPDHGPGPERGGRRRDRVGSGRHFLRPQHRAGGAHIHSAQSVEYRDRRLLRAVRRCRRAGTRVEPRSGARDCRRHPLARSAGAQGRAAPYRDVRARGALHGRLGQVLPEPARVGAFGQPGKLSPDMPPRLYGPGPRERRGAGRRQQIYHVAQRPLHGRLSGPVSRCGRSRAEDRGARPLGRLCEAGRRVLRRGVAGDRGGDVHARTGGAMEGEASDRLQPGILGRLLHGSPGRRVGAGLTDRRLPYARCTWAR